MANNQQGTEDLLRIAESIVPELWETVKSAYTVYRRNVMEVRLRYANQQWLEWDQHRRIFERESAKDPWVPQPDINRIGPWIDGIAPNFAQVPEVEALPVPEDDDISMGIADVANKLAKHAIKDNALRSDFGSREDRSNVASQMFTMGGCCFTRVRLVKKKIGETPKMGPVSCYSAQCLECGGQYLELEEPVALCPECGSPQVTIETSQQNAELMDEQGNPILMPLEKPRVIVDVEDPVCISPRPGAKSMDNAGWLFCAQRMTIEEIEERTGIAATSDGEYPDAYNFSQQYQNELMYYYLGYAPAEGMQLNQALFVEFFAEPGKKKEFPDGVYATYFNRKVQTAEPWSQLGPIDHPITKMDFEALPGIFFPRAKAFDLARIQEQLTHFDSICELHFKTNAVEPIVADKSSVVGEITGRGDKIVWWQSYAPGVKEPHRMKHEQLDPQLYERIRYLEQKGESISATVSVFRGEQPGSITAASAIQQLRGQAEMQFAKPVKNWNNGWKETIRKCIKLYQQYPLDELVGICGNDKLSAINDFKQADLDKVLEFVATSHGLPRTRDERRQEMMILYDKGALDTNDPKVRQKIFELFGDTGMMQNFNADATRARRNVRRMRETGQPELFRAGIDDAEIHLSIAQNAAKELDFDDWQMESQQAVFDYILQIQPVIAMESADERPAQPVKE